MKMKSLLIFMSLISAGLSHGAGQSTDNAQKISYRNAILVTPDKDLNARMKSGVVEPATIFNVSFTDEGIVASPNLKKGWTWLAAKGITVNGQSLSFFFVDGLIYSNTALKTSHRRMKFQKDVTKLIAGKNFTIAFYTQHEIERELVIFSYSEDTKPEELKIGRELWGEEKSISCSYDKNGKAFMSILKMADEFRPWFIRQPGEDVRTTMSLNRGWKFFKGEIPSGKLAALKTDWWQDIDIPHCWNATDAFDARNIYDGYEINDGYYRGPGWYKKEFMLDETQKNKNVRIEFEGAFQVAEVWFNGTHLGRHVGGYTGFDFDVTALASFGASPNTLVVRVDNSYNYDIPPHSADFTMYGGIYRDVNLVLNDRLFITDSFVAEPRCLSRTEAQLSVRALVQNKSGKIQSIEFKNLVLNAGGEIVASMSTRDVLGAGTAKMFSQLSDTITNPALWSTEHPNLYQLQSYLLTDGRIVDKTVTRIGFRWYTFHPDSGFFLNGEYLKLKGVNRHQDYPMLGYALPDSLHARDMVIIKEVGANFVRLAHYPQDPAVLDACDSLGILVWEEIPVVNSVGGREYQENAKQMMREMIERDRHHPSVILWGIANECAMVFSDKQSTANVKEFLAELNAVAKKLDPNRLTVQAHNDLTDDSIFDITDVAGRNRYFGWYTDPMSLFETELDREHKENPKRVLFIGEYGCEAKIGYHVDNPRKFDHSEDYQLNFHEYYWKNIASRRFVSGSAVWVGFDFGSFVKIGNIPRINQKGIWDSRRQPKDLYYFYKSQWTQEPMVYIVSHTRTEYTGKARESREFRIYSNCENVELSVNGQSLGLLASQYVYRWNVQLQPGHNVLRAVGTTRLEKVEDTIRVHYTVQ